MNFLSWLAIGWLVLILTVAGGAGLVGWLHSGRAVRRIERETSRARHPSSSPAFFCNVCYRTVWFQLESGREAAKTFHSEFDCTPSTQGIK